MTAADYLAKAKALSEGATEGPWTVVAERYGYDPRPTYAVDPAHGSQNVCHVTRDDDPADAEFIAFARDFVPKAVAALEAVVSLLADTAAAPWTRTTGAGIEIVAIDAASLHNAIEDVLR